MIVWQGFGFLAALIPIIFIGVIGAIDETHTMTYGFEMALILSAVAVWFVGKKLNSKQGKILIDPETNAPVEIKNKHTLFWIPMEWFAVVIAAFAIYGVTTNI
jgi:hypothetical protein